MTPRFLTTIGAIGPRVFGGGEIFSKVKAGRVFHLVVELRHSSKSPGHLPNDPSPDCSVLSDAGVKIQA